MTISTLNLSGSQYKTLQKLQKQFSDATSEASNSRLVDVGLSLGRLTGTSVNYRVQESSLESRLQSNKVVDNRLDLIDDAMEAISKSASDIQTSALVAKKYPQYQSLAKSALQQLQGSLNTADGGLYVFGGTNADVAPITNVDTGLTAAKANYDAFLTAVAGPTKDASKVTSAQMTAFLSDAGYVATDYPTVGTNTTFSFMDTVKNPAWGTNWSKASDDVTQAGISKTETIDTSVSANNDAFKKVTAAYSMLATIDITALSDAVKDVVSQTAAVTLAAGTDGITAQRALVGTRQNRIDAANAAMTSQKDIVSKAFNDMEGVDPYEASQKMNALELQLNTAMAATVRIQKLSILDYL
ncbi:flagellar hook-associated family protein [Aureimonas leprariae]|uniref:Flagellin n=1 Tax=Plantimonas leprariae TaxID=2615207 RepID=A0A7V7PPI5_9HYPH|nr:flagellar hook-associated family protein [Aureimonas leprariae]KAB0679895.1 flagellar hook-associated family protein [Aureimonas leprariae]